MRFVAAFCLASLCPAQDDSDRTARDLLADAEAAIEKEEVEAAAVLLRHAIRASHGIADDAQRRNLQTKLRNTLTRIDTVYADEERARQSASRTLVLEAANDIKRGWHRMARILLDHADRILPGSARETRAQLAATDGDGTGGSLHEEWFAKPYYPMGEAGWTIGPDEIRSPALGGKTVMLLTERELDGSYEIATELRLGTAPRKVAIAFGFTPEGQYHLFELSVELTHTELRLFYWDGRQIVELGRQLATLTRAERRSWLPVTLRVEDSRITGAVGDVESVAGTVHDGGSKGRFGFFISGDSRTQDPLPIRLVGVDS